MPGRVKTKKACCQSHPRCKSCPVVMKRLERTGHAVWIDKRSFLVLGGAKQAVKRARAR